MYDVKKILVPLDFSDVSRAALSAGLQLAAYHGAEVYVLHVHEGMDDELQERISKAPSETVISDTIDFDENSIKEAVELETMRCRDSERPLPDLRIHPVVSGGDWLDVALQMVKEHRIDLIVTGTHGPKGIKGMLLGSMSERLVAKSTVSVMVVKPKGYPYLRD